MGWTQNWLFFFFWCKDVFFGLFDDHNAKDNIDDEVDKVDNVVTMDFHRLKRKERKLKSCHEKA